MADLLRPRSRAAPTGVQAGGSGQSMQTYAAAVKGLRGQAGGDSPLSRGISVKSR